MQFKLEVHGDGNAHVYAPALHEEAGEYFVGIGTVELDEHYYLEALAAPGTKNGLVVLRNRRQPSEPLSLFSLKDSKVIEVEVTEWDGYTLVETKVPITSRMAASA